MRVLSAIFTSGQGDLEGDNDYKEGNVDYDCVLKQGSQKRGRRRVQVPFHCKQSSHKHSTKTQASLVVSLGTTKTITFTNYKYDYFQDVWRGVLPEKPRQKFLWLFSFPLDGLVRLISMIMMIRRNMGPILWGL